MTCISGFNCYNIDMKQEKDYNNDIEKLKEMVENSLKSDCSCINDNQYSYNYNSHNRNKEIIDDRDRYIGVDNFTANGILVK